MASEQWLLNDTSVASGAYFTAVTGGSYKLKNSWVTTRNRVTSSPTPYEGAGCYASGVANEEGFRFLTSADADITGTSGTYYFDAYIYLPTGFTDFVFPFIASNDTLVQYSWLQPNADTSLAYASYDTFYGLNATNVTATGKFSTNAWFRIQGKTNQYGINEFRVFVGGNINGASPSTTVTAIDFNSVYGYGTFEKLAGLGGNGSTYPVYLDNIKFDDAAYPTRSTAYTASASSTISATGAASLTKSLTGSATGTETATGTGSLTYTANASASSSITASGTAAATKTVSITASATITASGTAAASSTQALSATSSITGTGTAAASTTSPTKTLAGSGTASASGLADLTLRPLQTATASSSVTASGTTTFNKSQALAASASATATASVSLIAIQTIAATASVTATATADALITTRGAMSPLVRTFQSMVFRARTTATMKGK